MATKKKLSSLSVFFPAYNEEENIALALERAVSVVSKITTDYEIMVVDDGSRDKTSDIVKGYIKTNPKIRLIQHGKNRGYGAALKTGFENSGKELIFYTDSDLQFNLAEISRLLKFIDDYDLVIGYRIKRKDPFMRLIAASVYKNLVRLILGLKVKDPDCAFKLCRKAVIDKIKPFQGTRGADVELLVKAIHYGFRIKEVGVEHLPRLKGKSEATTFLNVIRPKIVYLLLREALNLRRFKN
ncbi:glycosyltransferase family 2 protein [Candidatus Woesearchaeota archaeon]|nr:glycosyltransferase family 2 protein [Candidatus Woesearchaeota archaeon]